MTPFGEPPEWLARSMRPTDRTHEIREDAKRLEAERSRYHDALIAISDLPPGGVVLPAQEIARKALAAGP